MKVKNYFQAVLNWIPSEYIVVEIGYGANMPWVTLLEAFIPSIEHGRGVAFGEQAGGRVCLPHWPLGVIFCLFCALGPFLDKYLTDNFPGYNLSFNFYFYLDK